MTDHRADFEEASTRVATRRLRELQHAAIINLIEQRGQLREVLLEISGHLHAAIVQQSPSDDQIIMGHVRDAATLACQALKSSLIEKVGERRDGLSERRSIRQ